MPVGFITFRSAERHREEKMKLTTKFVATTCIALPALLMPVLAQQGAKRTPLGTIDFLPGYQAVMGLSEIAPGTCIGRHTHPGILTPMSSKGKRS